MLYKRQHAYLSIPQSLQSAQAFSALVENAQREGPSREASLQEQGDEAAGSGAVGGASGLKQEGEEEEEEATEEEEQRGLAASRARRTPKRGVVRHQPISWLGVLLGLVEYRRLSLLWCCFHMWWRSCLCMRALSAACRQPPHLTPLLPARLLPILPAAALWPPHAGVRSQAGPWRGARGGGGALRVLRWCRRGGDRVGTQAAGGPAGTGLPSRTPPARRRWGPPGGGAVVGMHGLAGGMAGG